MSTPSNDDLFAPSLREEDDATGFDQPWHPWTLVVITFFCGLIAGGGLLALNFRRLGMKGRLYPTLAIAALGHVLIVGTGLWISYSGMIDPGDRDSSRMLSWGGKAVACLIAILVARPQQRRYRLFEMSNLPGGKLLWPALAAIGAALLVDIPVVALYAYMVFLR
jgi:hypothetical protein